MNVLERENGYDLLVAEENGGEMLFCISSSAFLIDCAGKPQQWATVEKGMAIAAVIEENTPVMLSLPPKIGNAYGFILCENFFVHCGTFDEELTDKKACLKIVVGENTEVLALGQDAKEDISLTNQPLVIVYGRTTRSIPAETIPECVIVFQNLTE